MSTHSEQLIQAASTFTSRLVTRVLGQTRQFVCGLHGHDALLHFEKGRLSLQCTSCDYETPGWDLQAAQAARVERQDGSRVVKMPLVHQRRVA